MGNKMLTTKQKAALERAWELSKSAELILGYLHQMRSDDHLAGLMNLLGRSARAYEDAYDGAYREHEAAEGPITLTAARKLKVVRR